MLDPRPPRGAFARLAFVASIGLALLFAAISPRSAHAAGGGRPMAQTHAWSDADDIAARSDALAEASRWFGHGNPTGKPGPWCAWFASFVLERTGHAPLPNGLAISALDYGRRVADPNPGDLAVMRGHVTFFAGWDGDDAFLGLGGNQSRRVTVARFARRAVIAFVRPA